MPLQREACPDYDIEVLYDVLLNHARTEGAKVAFSFGIYDAVQISHAVRGSALLRCAGVLKALLAAAPQGMFRYSDLKMCLKNVCMQMPELQQGRWRNASLDDWAGGTAERCMVLLAHLRRLHHSSVRLAQCSSKLSEPEQDELADLLSRLAPEKMPFNRGMSMAESVISDGGRFPQMSPRSGPPRDTNLMTQTPQVFTHKVHNSFDQRSLYLC
jgi:hypothetical protein